MPVLGLYGDEYANDELDGVNKLAGTIQGRLRSDIIQEFMQRAGKIESPTIDDNVSESFEASFGHPQSDETLRVELLLNAGKDSPGAITEVHATMRTLPDDILVAEAFARAMKNEFQSCGVRNLSVTGRPGQDGHLSGSLF